LIIRPPHESSARSGEYPFHIAVRSATNLRESASIPCVLTIQAYEHFTADMRPKALKNKGVCRVLVRNEGNAEATYSIHGRDPAEAINFEKPPGRLRIPAGDKAVADISLAARQRPYFGASKVLPFEVLVGTSGGARQSLPGRLEVKPVFPTWMIPLFLALFFLLCVTGGLLFSFIRDRNEDATRQLELVLVEQTAVAQTAQAAQTRSADLTTQEAGAAAATGTSIFLTAQAEGDDDSDGLSNMAEEQAGTDPKNPDTDGDGLNDGAEVNQYGTDPKNQDSDGDTLTDGAEVNEHKTSPTEKDTDGDGKTDGVEVVEGSNPLLPPTHTPTPSHTPTSSPSPTPSPTATGTPTPTPTSAVQTLELPADDDNYWPSGLILMIACLVGTPCPTAAPVAEQTTGPVLLLEHEDCTGLFSCFQGLVAVKFTLNAIPSGAQINNATLRLNLISGVNDNLTVGVYPATSAWSENQAARPSCDLDQEVATLVGLNPGPVSWNVTDLVRQQHQNQANNFGFCLRLINDGERRFTSRQGTPGLGPLLQVAYQP
jgi:hypothetical protein